MGDRRVTFAQLRCQSGSLRPGGSGHGHHLMPAMILSAGQTPGLNAKDCDFGYSDLRFPGSPVERARPRSMAIAITELRLQKFHRISGRRSSAYLCPE